jgi:hypothetical protein
MVQTKYQTHYFESSFSRVRVKQHTYIPLVSATEMAIWQAILTKPNLPSPSPSLLRVPLT